MEKEQLMIGSIVVDSCMWIELLRGSATGKKLQEILDKEQSLFISSLTLTEVYYYLLKKKEPSCQRFIDFIRKMSFVISVNEDIALNAALLRLEKGWGTGDAIIFATGLSHHAKVLTCDSDFSGEEGALFMGK
ncbi:type II toxin-antitoxin system VapC family toxin [Candidatus Woesearchaeota archaeon]|nr:type II toxin-antitoxin system VapC family toxin [Candidatus Woesearchaeota archaeon]